MPTLYVLVGIPGSGKSTWVSNQKWAKDCAYISTDKHVDEYAASLNKTYNYVFHDYMPTAVKLMSNDVIAARKAGKDIIWDQTSTSIKSRKKKFVMLPNYRKIAVVFLTPEKEELARRLDSREGKHIPKKVVRQMISSFQIPTTEEGFDEVWMT